MIPMQSVYIDVYNLVILYNYLLMQLVAQTCLYDVIVRNASIASSNAMGYAASSKRASVCELSARRNSEVSGYHHRHGARHLRSLYVLCL